MLRSSCPATVGQHGRSVPQPAEALLAFTVSARTLLGTMSRSVVTTGGAVVAHVPYCMCAMLLNRRVRCSGVSLRMSSTSGTSTSATARPERSATLWLHARLDGRRPLTSR